MLKLTPKPIPFSCQIRWISEPVDKFKLLTGFFRPVNQIWFEGMLRAKHRFDYIEECCTCFKESDEQKKDLKQKMVLLTECQVSPMIGYQSKSLGLGFMKTTCPPRPPVFPFFFSARGLWPWFWKSDPLLSLSISQRPGHSWMASVKALSMV